MGEAGERPETAERTAPTTGADEVGRAGADARVAMDEGVAARGPADPGAPTPTEAARRISRLAVAGWVSYDLGNTLFSFNIVSIYLPLWIVNDLGGQDADYGLASSVSMGLMFLTAPLLGAISDQARGRLPYLLATTLACVALTVFLGQGGLFATLALFVAANYFYQAGLIFYDALLPAVSTPETRGRVGGIGIGVGYLGSFLGVGLGLFLLAGDPSAKPRVFQATAALFLVFALPCFLFVREPRRADARPLSLDTVRAAFGELRQTLGRARNYPGLRRFLLGRVFYADAANTLIAFMGIYVTNEVGFGERDTQLLLLSGIAAGVVGGLVWGVVVDRLGSKRTLDVVLVLWLGVFVLTAAIGWFGLPGWLFWIAGPLAGFALGGTWTADRPLMLQLAPPRYLGQFYGLYAMVGRFAAIAGPLLWSVVVDGLNLGRPVAVLTLAVWIVVAFAILRAVPTAPREWSPDDLVPVEAT
ncbi:MAG: MFS transporter [Chloroflexi bacterium]|nr:MFS transporter [Chloroflexota bacterium]